MSLRVGVLGDLEAVLRLEREAFEAPHWTAGDYRVVLSGVNGGAVRRRTFVWDEGARVVGFSVGMVLVAGRMSDGQIENLAVAGGARRGGIGRVLCEAAMAWCGEQGAASVGLEVRASNLGAIALYRGLGFEAVGVRKKYYRGPVEDGVVMERALVGPVGANAGYLLE